MLDPACEALYVQAIDYLGRKTQDWTPDQRAAAFRHPQFHVHEQRIVDAMETGDRRATQDACKAWWRWVLSAESTAAGVS